jgi:hypothetical protein
MQQATMGSTERLAVGGAPQRQHEWAGASRAYTLVDIADWLSRALQDTLAAEDGTKRATVPAHRTDAQTALAVYEDWKARMGYGAGF